MGEPKELIATGTFDEYVAQLKAATKRSLDISRLLIDAYKRVLEIEFEDKSPYSGSNQRQKGANAR